jgi:hypothetical protein
MSTIKVVEIVISVMKSKSGRLSGTVCSAGSRSGIDFDGTMELLAALQRICAADEPSEWP